LSGSIRDNCFNAEICVKSKVFAVAATALVGMALSACGQSAKPEGEQAAEPASAPEAKPGLSLSGARLVLPAVSGNPAAAYFTLSNGGDAPVAVAGVHIEGAESTEIHQTSGGSMNLLASPEVPAKGTLQFVPGGNHVMVFGLGETLAPNKTSEVTVTFGDGDKISAPIRIEAPGSPGEAGN